ncbi:MAG: hypothetical protein A3C44_07075 [Gammaproteobacteria bacterium RIFCSPHIGHO2_02_FULL_39_13]|nr:MAG: hypothetical protein A3C44_07075 [Gammaproteobacteria bacterium RIFCSPHIGHO2_02_FULL_39_13]OGT49997.1 MAG: hypothetical protein A3E53_02180 [Gammaproteobacteria bacterium RIFCSPHIGHO2_12_FULL_39_24]
MIEFELDGKQLSTPEGTTIIEAADEAGVYIPRFCYHKKLSVAANCRMCLVEVEKSGKPLPACATPITPNMKVKTKSDMALKAQRDVMEFLLINHPLDCPICDQGGECELQDLSMGFGCGKSEYNEPKRAVHSPDIGPLIETEMTRCIQCTRCVRFGEEVAGLRELGVVNRGEKEEITTYVQHFLKSEVSGNIIDICPVGALTNKPARYAVRGWEIKEHATISPHDCVGTNMYVHTRGHEYSKERTIFRAVPRENEKINETWMSDRDRFSVEALYHEDRIYKPVMKKNNQWIEVEWQYALDAIAHLTSHIGSDIAGITGYSSTLEEYYLFQKLIRALGSNHVDHRIRELDFTDQLHRSLFPQLNCDIAEIENLDTLLLVGSNIKREQPIISTRIFKASQENLSVMAVNPRECDFVFPLSEKIIDEDIIQSLMDIVAILQSSPTPTPTIAEQIAERLRTSKSAIFLGAYAQHHPNASIIRTLANQIAQLTNSTVGILTDGANSAGAWIAGCIPHRAEVGVKVTAGRDAKSLLTSDPVSTYFILDTELEWDSAYAEKALENLSNAKLVVCFSTFATDKMREYADFILPITPFSENEGTYVNVNGVWQSFKASGIPHGDSKPAWKILRVLANRMNLSGFDYESTSMIIDKLKNKFDQHVCCEDCKKIVERELPASSHVTVPEWDLYRDNALVRRSKSLQELIA